jgi:hypothetical protein
MSDDEKRGPNLGSRTIGRHATQAGATSVGLMGILQATIELGWMDQAQAFLALGLIPPVLTSIWKGWDGLRMKERLNAAIDKRYPILLVFIAVVGSGCAVQLGTMAPKHFTSLDGTMLIACETRGILLTMGDSDICSNSMRGGRVSQTFSDMTLGVVRTGGAIIAGFFGGAGAGVAQAVRADEAQAQVVAPSAPPIAESSASTLLPAGPAWPENPFTPGE